MKIAILGCLACSSVLAMASETVLDLDTQQPKQVALKVGDTLAIQLESNPSTGYQWSAKAPTNLKCTKVSYVAKAPNLPGASGIRTFVFKAMGRGKGTVLFTYARSWEKNVAPVKTKKLAVQVK